MDDWKEIVAEWRGGGAFTATNAAGGVVYMGKIADQPGLSPGLSPMELLLAALAGCTGVDVASILEKKRQPLKEMKIRVRGKRRETYPRVYTEIEVQYLFWGDGLSEQAVQQAIALSEEKYCSVSSMLKSAAEIRFTYQIFPDGGDPQVE
jgi:putative redox protein